MYNFTLCVVHSSKLGGFYPTLKAISRNLHGTIQVSLNLEKSIPKMVTVLLFSPSVL